MAVGLVVGVLVGVAVGVFVGAVGVLVGVGLPDPPGPLRTTSSAKAFPAEKYPLTKMVANVADAPVVNVTVSCV